MTARAPSATRTRWSGLGQMWVTCGGNTRRPRPFLSSPPLRAWHLSWGAANRSEATPAQGTNTCTAGRSKSGARDWASQRREREARRGPCPRCWHVTEWGPAQYCSSDGGHRLTLANTGLYHCVSQWLPTLPRSLDWPVAGTAHRRPSSC